LGTTLQLSRRPALLVVDVQRDFCPGGALAAEGGLRIMPALNRFLADAHAERVPVYASRDWHPAVTQHFQAYGGEWPPHCIQHTAGAEFHPELALPANTVVITKGEDPDQPGYSAFEGHTSDGWTLLEDLRSRSIDRLYVGGIATDYCVKQSVLDARRAGLGVTVLADAVTGIDVHPGDVSRAFMLMQEAGAEIVRGVSSLTAPEAVDAHKRPS
jgi:nicotinamidase/pyrazinamidase